MIMNLESAVAESYTKYENLENQYSSLFDLHTCSLNNFDSLFHENTQLVHNGKLLRDEISHITSLFTKANLKAQTLSDENKILIEEKHSISNKLSASSQKLSILQNKYHYQKKSVDLLKGDLESLKKSSAAEKDSLVIERDSFANKFAISNTKRNRLSEECAQLKTLNSDLKKENKFLVSKDRKLQSRFQGFTGDDFDASLDSMKQCCLSIAQHLTSQKEGCYYEFGLIYYILIF